MEISESLFTFPQLATQTTLEEGVQYGLKLLGAIVTFVVGWIGASWAGRGVRRVLEKFPAMDSTVILFLARAARYGVMIITIVAILNQFGVHTTSIIAMLGAAGIAIGLALQGTLSNIAAGVMLLILRPFRVGDYIDAAGFSGTVQEISLFLTELKMADGVFLAVPNSTIFNTAIMNYNRNKNRRLDVIVGVDYTDDLDGAIVLLQGIMENHPDVHKEPVPEVLVHSLGDSSVNLRMRCWGETNRAWVLPLKLQREAKLLLEKNGFTIPFPQRTVHHVNHTAGSMHSTHDGD